MIYKYGVEDMEFNELNFEFVKDYEFYLKTVKNNANNTALKYITNFKKIVLTAMDKELLTIDPFKRFKGKKTRVPKKPLTGLEFQVADVAIAVGLAALTISNPVALVGFGIYGILDATGALDSIKNSLGGDTVILKSNFEK